MRPIAAEMQRLQNATLEPGEQCQLPASIAQGDGILALLEHRYGTAGNAETQVRLGCVDDITGYLEGLLSEAAKNLGISEQQLQQLRR